MSIWIAYQELDEGKIEGWKMVEKSKNNFLGYQNVRGDEEQWR